MESKVHCRSSLSACVAALVAVMVLFGAGGAGVATANTTDRFAWEHISHSVPFGGPRHSLHRVEATTTDSRYAGAGASYTSDWHDLAGSFNLGYGYSCHTYNEDLKYPQVYNASGALTYLAGWSTYGVNSTGC